MDASSALITEWPILPAVFVMIVAGIYAIKAHTPLGLVMTMSAFSGPHRQALQGRPDDRR